jgi:DNA polymerase I
VTKPRRLVLVDGSGFIFRAYHALPPLTRADGAPIGAVAGFCNMLAKLLREPESEHLAVVFDVSRVSFRSQIFPDYKAHRPPPPEDLVPQFGLIREAVRAFGVPALEAADYEADDLIAAYAAAAQARGWPVRIVSGDKDFMQLVEGSVELWDPIKQTLIDLAAIEKKFGVTPDKVIDVQALAGDSSDNVPGVPGIGVKTAAELINHYGDLETLLTHAHEIKQPKRREALLANAELARISKRLVTLDAHAPLPVPVDALHVQTDPAALRAFLEQQGLKSLLARLNPAPASPAPALTAAAPATASLTPQPIPASYTLIQSVSVLKDWLSAVPKTGLMAVTTEASDPTPAAADWVGIALACAEGVACYVPLQHRDLKSGEAGGLELGGAAIPQVTISELCEILGPILAEPSILIIGHNLKRDLQIMARYGLKITSYDDIMLISASLAAGAHGHGLVELAKLHCEHEMTAIDAITGTGKKQLEFAQVPLAQATTYAAESADFILRLWRTLKPKLTQQGVTHVYERMERPLVPVIAAMEQAGVMIDPEVLRILSQDFGKRQWQLSEQIFALAGRSFNLASPKQLGDVLFAEMGLPGGVRGKTGAYGTGIDVLEPLEEQGHEIARLLLDWRALTKLMSTYTETLPHQINARTGRVHTSFSMVGAATGRLSSTDPNLQNIPIRTEDGRAIRRAFVAPAEHLLLSVDYSQIELRLAAEMAGIQALQQAFQDQVDIHALTAAQVFGRALSAVTAAERRAAKAVNFGIIYGISGFGLAKQIGCSAAEANQFIKTYLDRFHELRDWMEATKRFAHQHGYVETLFGRRIYLPTISDKNAARRNFAERQAINAPLQGTAADIIKRAMIRVTPALQAAGLKARLMLQVHDELLFEVASNEIEATAALVKQIMTEAAQPAHTLKVPLIAEAGWAKNWAEAH